MQRVRQPHTETVLSVCPTSAHIRATAKTVCPSLTTPHTYVRAPRILDPGLSARVFFSYLFIFIFFSLSPLLSSARARRGPYSAVFSSSVYYTRASRPIVILYYTCPPPTPPTAAASRHRGKNLQISTWCGVGVDAELLSRVRGGVFYSHAVCARALQLLLQR